MLVKIKSNLLAPSPKADKAARGKKTEISVSIKMYIVYKRCMDMVPKSIYTKSRAPTD